MSYIDVLRHNLYVSPEYDLKVLSLHTFDPQLQIDVFEAPPCFNLTSQTTFQNKVMVICTLNGSLIALTINKSGNIILNESGTIDAELALDWFGYNS